MRRPRTVQAIISRDRLRFSAFEVEETLGRHPAIQSVFASDIHRNCEIILRPGHRPPTLNELRSFALRAQLPFDLLPNAVNFIDMAHRVSRNYLTSGKHEQQYRNASLSSLHECEALICDCLAALRCNADFASSKTIHEPFAAIGVNSTVAVRLVELLNARLAPLVMRPTVVFEQPSIRALADSIALQLELRIAPGDIGTTWNGSGTTNPLGIHASALCAPGVVRCTHGLAILLSAGGDAICSAFPVRWSLPEAVSSGFLPRIELFDARSFSIAPVEASTMDPQQRLLLETCYGAVHSSGLRRAELAGRDASAFVGIMNADFANCAMGVLPPLCASVYFVCATPSARTHLTYASH